MKLYYLILLFLVGCGHTPDKEIELVPVFSPVVCEDFGRLESIQPLPVVFVNAKTTDGFQVLGLRGDSYSNLAINSADTLRYIIEQKGEISYLENCIENHNSKANEKGPPE